MTIGGAGSAMSGSIRVGSSRLRGVCCACSGASDLRTLPLPVQLKWPPYPGNSPSALAPPPSVETCACCEQSMAWGDSVEVGALCLGVPGLQTRCTQSCAKGSNSKPALLLAAGVLGRRAVSVPGASRVPCSLSEVGLPPRCFLAELRMVRCPV